MLAWSALSTTIKNTSKHKKDFEMLPKYDVNV